MKKKIEFSIEDYMKDLIEVYAQVKGFANASAFARHSTIAMMKKVQLTAAERVRIEKNHGLETLEQLAPALEAKESK